MDISGPSVIARKSLSIASSSTRPVSLKNYGSSGSRSLLHREGNEDLSVGIKCLLS